MMSRMSTYLKQEKESPMDRTETLCTAVRDRLKEPEAVGPINIVDLPRAVSVTDFWNAAIEAAALAAEEIARSEFRQASGGFFISLGANESAAAIRKLKRD